MRELSKPLAGAICGKVVATGVAKVPSPLLRAMKKTGVGKVVGIPDVGAVVKFWMTKARSALPSPLRSPTAKLLAAAPAVLRVTGPLNPLTVMVGGRVMVETGFEGAFGGAELDGEDGCRGRGDGGGVGDEVGEAVAVDVAEVRAGVDAGGVGCADEGAVTVAHENVGGGEAGVVAAVESAVGQAGEDVHVAVAVEVGDGDVAGVVDGDVAGSLLKCSVSVAEPGGNDGPGADDEVDFSVVVQVAGCDAGSLVGGDVLYVGKCGCGQLSEGAIAIVQQDESVGADDVLFAGATQIGCDEGEDGCVEGAGAAVERGGEALS